MSAAGGAFVATSYGPPWGGIQGGGITATGVDLRSAPKSYLVAVDPSVIPLGTKLQIWPNPFGDPGAVFTAADTGGAIKGRRIDFYDWRGRAAQQSWGVQHVTVNVAGAAGSSSSTPSSSSGASTSTSSGGSGFFADVQRIGLQLVMYGAGAWLAFTGARRLFTAAGPAT